MAIPTIYRGIEYRSRLEAKWAAFFKLLDWQFTYEPFDGDGYIPDFIIHGDAPLMIEIKPASNRLQFEAPIGKVVKGLYHHTTNDILIIGVDPLPTLDTCWAPTGHPAAGLLGEHDGVSWGFNAAIWMQCEKCGAWGVFHETNTYNSRPCGHYDGDHYILPVSRRTIEAHWAEATNEVKWYGRDAA